MAAGIVAARRVGAIVEGAGDESTCAIPGGCGVLEMDGVTGWLKGDGL